MKKINFAKEINESIKKLRAHDVIATGDISDTHHTFDELYEHRCKLFAVICNTYPEKAWKSKSHDDGSMFDGMFIVGIDTPKGSYTYHYENKYWDLFEVAEWDLAPAWDGHIPNDIDRIFSLIGIGNE